MGDSDTEDAADDLQDQTNADEDKDQSVEAEFVFALDMLNQDVDITDREGGQSSDLTLGECLTNCFFFLLTLRDRIYYMCNRSRITYPSTVDFLLRISSYWF